MAFPVTAILFLQAFLKISALLLIFGQAMTKSLKDSNQNIQKDFFSTRKQTVISDCFQRDILLYFVFEPFINLKGRQFILNEERLCFYSILEIKIMLNLIHRGCLSYRESTVYTEAFLLVCETRCYA